MLRRTLLLFFGFVLLVLAVTVGYALLGLSGPRTAIADAAAAADDGRYAEAVRLLDIAERTLTAHEQAELLPDILDRRFRAHQKLGNVPAARRDIETLLALDPTGGGTPDLQVAHGEILLAADEPEAVLDLVSAWLERSTGETHARLLELAGEAHQALYRRGIGRLMKTLAQNLAEAARQRAVVLLRTALYRAADDPVAERAQALLRDLVRRSAATPLGFEAMEHDLADVRAGIQQALSFFRRSLEAPEGKPGAALRGLTFALENAGRVDEQRAIEDLYLRRFSHPDTMQAVVVAVERELAAGRFAAAARLAARFLPLGTARERVVDERFPPAAKRLLVAQARALLALGEKETLDRLHGDLEAVHQTGLIEVLPELFFVQLCVAAQHDRDPGPAFAGLVWKVGSERPRSSEELDLYDLAVDLKLQAHRARGEAALVDETLDAWCKARPADSRARRERCTHLLASGRFALAIEDAAHLLQATDRDEDTLALYVRAVDEAAAATGRDAKSTLTRMLARGSYSPAEPHDPALYLALGELALRQGAPALAMRCGDLAGRAFNWAEWPRRLAATAALQLGQPALALQAAEVYRDAHPRSPTALSLYQAALRQADRRAPELRFDLAVHGTPDPELARALLSGAIARDQRALLPDLCRRTMYRFGGDAQVMLRAAMGLLAVNDTAAARDLLLRIPTAFPADRAACVEAATRFLLLEAKTAPDSPLLALAVRVLTGHADGDAETLLGVAAELEEAGQPRLVLAVLEPILGEDAYREARSGKVYALAGRASLALDRPVKAEEYLVQALGFPDGEVAAPSFALLCAQQDRRADAESALWQKEAVDEASACLLLRLDRPDPAVRWARARRSEAPFDVTANLILALAGSEDDRRQVPGGFTALVRSEGKAVLEGISMLAMPGFQVMGEKVVRALHERVPDSSLAHFLWARALALVGKRDAAVAELTELTQKAPSFLPAYDEVLRITEGGWRGDLGEIGPRISNSVLSAPNAATPRMRAMVGQALATQIGMANQDPAAALAMLARLWIQFPQESRAGLENVTALVTRGRTGDAFELLQQLEHALPTTERSRFLDFYFSLGRMLIAAGSSELQGELDARARAVVDQEGPFGAAVHWLVDRLAKQHGPFRDGPTAKPHAEPALALLTKHLEFVPQLRDRDLGAVLRTLDRLQEIEDRDAVLQRVDDLLRADPSLLPVWIRRAQLLATRGEVADALASLRWIFAYVPYPPALREFARIGGEHDALSAADQELLAADAARLADDPQAAYPLGVAAYRRGDLARAGELLAQAPPRPDGGHLWFRGLLALAAGEEASVAQQAFAALAEQHPESPHAAAARHLAVQLDRLLAKE